MNSSSPVTKKHGRRILLMAFGATTSMVLGVSSVMPMVPMLAKIFAVNQTAASLVITAFTLPGILFSLPAGVLADRFGRKAVLFPSLLLFSFAGVACAFAPNLNTLLFFRFLQGIGAAPLGVLNATILADTWSGPERLRMISLNMTVLGICTALYPSLGGVLAHVGWRYPFLLPLLVLPVAFLAWRTPLANPGRAESFQRYLKDVKATFRERRILALLTMTLITFTLLYGPIVTCFPVLAYNRFHTTPSVIGTAMIFSSFGMALTASQLSTLTRRFSARNLLLCSQVLYAAVLLIAPNMPDIFWMLPIIFLYGVGQGLNIPNVQGQLLQEAPPAQRALVMSVNGMVLRAGQTIAPVSFSWVMALGGIDWGFYAGIGLAALLSFFALAFLPKRMQSNAPGEENL